METRMRRIIITPPDLAGAALDELKQWLAITTSQEDAALLGLLRASLDTCEAFTRQMPLHNECEELHEAARGWQELSTHPVRATTAIEHVAMDGSRSALPAQDYEFDLEADGSGRFRLLAGPSAGRVAMRFTAGIAEEWETLPDALRHGILRLAAHHYRQRDEDGARSGPPSVVSALWSPWRRLRLT